MHEVARIDRQIGQVTGKFDSVALTAQAEFVAQVDWVDQCFQFVEAVRAFPQDVDQQIDFAWRFPLQRHKRKSANKCWRWKISAFRHRGRNYWSKTRKRLPGIIGATSPPLKPREVSVENSESLSTPGR